MSCGRIDMALVLDAIADNKPECDIGDTVHSIVARDGTILAAWAGLPLNFDTPTADDVILNALGQEYSVILCSPYQDVCRFEFEVSEIKLRNSLHIAGEVFRESSWRRVVVSEGSERNSFVFEAPLLLISSVEEASLIEEEIPIGEVPPIEQLISIEEVLPVEVAPIADVSPIEEVLPIVKAQTLENTIPVKEISSRKEVAIIKEIPSKKSVWSLKNLMKVACVCLGAIAMTPLLVFSNVTAPAPTPAPIKPITVYVKGHVLKPGVYQLPGEAKVEDAINAAGGLSYGANPSNINASQKVEDCEEILVPGNNTIPHTQEQKK